MVESTTETRAFPIRLAGVGVAESVGAARRIRARATRAVSSAVAAVLLFSCQSSTPNRSSTGGSDGARAAQRITYGNRAFEVNRNITYAVHSGVRLRLDVYRPTGSEPLPAVLDIHGGGWFSGTRRRATLSPLGLADQNFVVFVPDYRLACDDAKRPLCGYHYRAPVSDLRAAVEWIRSHGSRFQASTASVAAAGTSAGGHLAQMLGLTGAAGTRADAVVSWSGSSKLAVRARSPASFATVVGYLGCRYAECPQRWRRMSPISHVSSDTSPMMLVQSRRDPIVPASTARLMARALRRHGVEVRLWMRVGRLHARFGPQVLKESARWLHRHM